MFKKLLGVIAGIFMVVVLLSGEARAEKKIGIIMWSDIGRYTDAKDGVMEQLKKEGFGESKVKFTVENAENSKTKAVEITQKFKAEKMDMILAFGTPATVIVAKDIKDVPIILCLVYDPVEAKLADSWESSGNNTTGVSNKVPMSQIVDNLKRLAPVKTLGVLYTPGEKNSEIQLKELQAVTQIKVIPVPLTNREGVGSLMENVVKTVDAIYFSGSSIVGEKASEIADIATKAKVITVTHVEDLVEKGVVLAVYANPHELGLLAEKKRQRY